MQSVSRDQHDRIQARMRGRVLDILESLHWGVALSSAGRRESDHVKSGREMQLVSGWLNICICVLYSYHLDIKSFAQTSH